MTRQSVESGERRTDMNLTVLVSTGNPAGAIVAISMLIMRSAGFPETRPFVLPSGGLRNAVRLIPLVEAPLLCRE